MNNVGNNKVVEAQLPILKTEVNISEKTPASDRVYGTVLTTIQNLMGTKDNVPNLNSKNITQLDRKDVDNIYRSFELIPGFNKENKFKNEASLQQNSDEYSLINKSEELEGKFKINSSVLSRLLNDREVLKNKSLDPELSDNDFEEVMNELKLINDEIAGINNGIVNDNKKLESLELQVAQFTDRISAKNDKAVLEKVTQKDQNNRKIETEIKPAATKHLATINAALPAAYPHLNRSAIKKIEEVISQVGKALKGEIKEMTDATFNAMKHLGHIIHHENSNKLTMKVGPDSKLKNGDTITVLDDKGIPRTFIIEKTEKITGEEVEEILNTLRDKLFNFFIQNPHHLGELSSYEEKENLEHLDHRHENVNKSHDHNPTKGDTSDIAKFTINTANPRYEDVKTLATIIRNQIESARIANEEKKDQIAADIRKEYITKDTLKRERLSQEILLKMLQNAECLKEVIDQIKVPATVDMITKILKIITVLDTIPGLKDTPEAKWFIKEAVSLLVNSVLAIGVNVAPGGKSASIQQG